MKKIYYLIAGLILLLVIGFVANAQGGKFFRFPGDIKVYEWISSPVEFLSRGGDWNNIQEFGAPNIGSVSVTSEYNATSTILNGVNVDTLIKSGSGALGSVIITNAGDTVFQLLNATTTDVTKRATGQSTTTIMIAQFPASASVGTYTFDSTFSKGLLFDVIGGSFGTSTITWRN